MTSGGDVGNLIRRVVVPRLHLLPGMRDKIVDSTTPALHRSGMVLRRHARPRQLAGTLCPNPLLANGTRFDATARHGLRTGHRRDARARGVVARRRRHRRDRPAGRRRHARGQRPRRTQSRHAPTSAVTQGDRSMRLSSCHAPPARSFPPTGPTSTPTARSSTRTRTTRGCVSSARSCGCPGNGCTR